MTITGSSRCDAAEMNLNHEVVVWSLALLSGLGIQRCHELWCRRISDLALLWLWCKPWTTAPFGPLAWKPPYAKGAALKSEKKNKQTYVFVLEGKEDSKY